MTKREAVKIVELHNAAARKRIEARRLGDMETEAIEQRKLDLMATDYDRASSVLLRRR